MTEKQSRIELLRYQFEEFLSCSDIMDEKLFIGFTDPMTICLIMAINQINNYREGLSVNKIINDAFKNLGEN